MAAAKKSKKIVALRKGRQGRRPNALTRRGKTSRPKRKVVVVKFPKRNYLSSCPLMPSFFNRRMRAHRFVAKKGKHPTKVGQNQRKVTLRLASRVVSSRSGNRKASLRLASRKASLRATAARKKSLRVTRKVPMKGKKKLLRLTKQKAAPRSHKAKKSCNSRSTCRNALQATLKEVAKKKTAKWVVTGAKRRRRGAGKDHEGSSQGGLAKDSQGHGSSLEASGLAQPTANGFPNVAS